MGQYLLKGYKMLGTCCSLCGVRYLLKGYKMVGTMPGEILQFVGIYSVLWLIQTLLIQNSC